MHQATRIKRHAQLWSAGETRVRRIGIGGAVFALIVLLTVIEPYHIESTGMQVQLISQKSKIGEIKTELLEIIAVRAKLDDMSKLLDTEPWTGEIQELKNKFSAGEVSQPRIESNAVLNQIADELRENLVAPVSEAIGQLNSDNSLAALPDNLDKAVVGWLATYEVVDWWNTRESKDDTTAAIGEELQSLLNKASENVPKIIEELEADQKKKTERLSAVESEIERLKDDLKMAVNRALPTWARDIIDVKQLLVLYPWLLAGIVFFLVGTALRASRHFHAMADGEGWSTDERRDPLLSSSWTLTPRGISGSFATFATYGSVLAVLGTCLYRSQDPPRSAAAGTVQAFVDVIAAQSNMSALVAYAFLAAAIVVVITALVWHRPSAVTG